MIRCTRKAAELPTHCSRRRPRWQKAAARETETPSCRLRSFLTNHADRGELQRGALPLRNLDRTGSSRSSQRLRPRQSPAFVFVAARTNHRTLSSLKPHHSSFHSSAARQSVQLGSTGPLSEAAGWNQQGCSPDQGSERRVCSQARSGCWPGGCASGGPALLLAVSWGQP